MLVVSNSAHYEDILKRKQEPTQRVIARPSYPISLKGKWQAFEIRLERGKFLMSEEVGRHLLQGELQE